MAEPAIPLRPLRCPRITDIPPVLRPREKLLRRGPEALTQAELLAVLIGTGTRDEPVLRLAARILRRHRLETLPTIPLAEWCRMPGLGPAGVCRFAACFELARRLRREEEREPPKICRPRDVWALVPELRRLRKEHLVALYLDAQSRLIARETLTIGSLNTTRTHPREILQPAIEHLALGFVLAHNHPSGSLTPSVDDVEFTRSVRRAGELLGIDLYDHVIISAKGFASLKEKGLL